MLDWLEAGSRPPLPRPVRPTRKCQPDPGPTARQPALDSDGGWGWSRWPLGQRPETHGTQKDRRGDQEGRATMATEARVFGDQPARHEGLYNRITVHAADGANVGAG